MLRPYIADYHSADVSDLASWSPDSLADIYFGLELSIGIAREEGADLFQVLVATPEALRKYSSYTPHMLGRPCEATRDFERANPHLLGRYFPARNMLVVMDYSWPDIRSVLEGIVDSCAGDSWDEIASKLSRYFHWEYEDHRVITDEELDELDEEADVGGASS
jgi:hypothetical protein